MSGRTLPGANTSTAASKVLSYEFRLWGLVGAVRSSLLSRLVKSTAGSRSAEERGAEGD